MDAYGTHLEVLSHVASKCPGPFLELGAGEYSTPMLSAICRARGIELVTIDSNKEWLSRFKHLEHSGHKMVLDPSFTSHAMYARKWGMVFVDHHPNHGACRTIEVVKLWNHADTFVFHDSDGDLYGWGLVKPRFAHQWESTRLLPHTFIGSHTMPIISLLPFVEPNSSPTQHSTPVAPIAKTTQWQYKSYTEIINDTHAWCDRLPPIQAVCGIPKSGTIIAALIAQRRNIPLLELSHFTSGGWNSIKPRGASRKTRGSHGPVLIVDDTSWSGESVLTIRAMAPNAKYGALYANVSAPVDFIGFNLDTPFHTAEYNLLRDSLAGYCICDLDGVFRKDFTQFPGGEESHEAEYIHWLRNANPTHLLPTYPVRAIVSASLGKFREHTEHWLAKHGIQYGELILPFNSLGDRQSANIAHTKATHYERFDKENLFVESEDTQAMEIHRVTGRPVFSIETNRLYQ